MGYSKRYITKWEIGGIFWIVIIGSLLHFTFEWSGNSKIVGIFSPVNESVWEHLKLGYWALTFFMLIEYYFIKPYANNYFMAKSLGILAMNVFIVIVFYSYTAITKEANLFIDIGSFIVGAIICQIIGIKIMNMKKWGNETFGLGLFILMGLILTLFTFYPPHLHIFMDSRTGTYGLD